MTTIVFVVLGAVILDWIVWGKFAAINSRRTRYRVTLRRATVLLLVAAWFVALELMNEPRGYYFPLVALLVTLSALYIVTLIHDVHRQPEIETPPRYSERDY